jgi:GT2 family glycosyltransferase
MAYRLVDVDPAVAFPDLALDQDESGIAVVVRRGPAPVAFVLRELPAGSALAAEELDQLLGREAGLAIVREALDRQLAAQDAGGESRPTPTMTVAVCTHGRPTELDACLDALDRSIAACDGVDLLVVDNAPPDDSARAVVQRHRRATYVTEPRVGLDFARNRALAEATGDLIAFVDDDVEVEEGWCDALRGALASDPEAGGCTGLVLPYEMRSDAQVRFELRGGFRRGTERLRHPAARRETRSSLYPYGAGLFGAGCNMAFRRGLLEELGGFDEALDTGRPLPGGGDIDMFFRVVMAGRSMLYEPRAVARHKHRPDHASLRRQYRSWGTGLMAFLTKCAAERPEDRAVMARLVRWWFEDQAKLVVHGALGNRGMTVDLALAELWGGLVGLSGEYGRSRRRVARIRAEAGDR